MEILTKLNLSVPLNMDLCLQSVLSPYHSQLDHETNFNFNQSEIGKIEYKFGDGDSATHGGNTTVANRLGIALLESR